MPGIPYLCKQGFIRAALVALPLVLAAPLAARADDRETTRIIAGVVALGLVAGALADDDSAQQVHGHGFDWRSDRPIHPRRLIRRGCGPVYPDVDYAPRQRQLGCRGGLGPGGYWDEPPKRHGYGYDYRRQTGHPSVISPNH